MANAERSRCPYPGCRYEGTDDDVNDHRTYAHQGELQAGSNLRGPA